MNISLKKGKFFPLIFIITIYLTALILLPLTFVEILGISDKNIVRILTLVFQVLAAIIIIVFTSKVKINSIESNVNKFSFIKSLAYGLLFFMIILLLQIILGVILQLFGNIYGFNPRSSNTSEIANAMKNYPILIIYVVILAPVLEELVFRKAIFAYLYDILSGSREVVRFVISSMLSGIIFALPHDGFTPIAVVYVIIAMVFAYSYKISSNIVVPIVAHILMNTIVVITQYFIL